MSEKEFAKLISKEYKKPWFRLSDLNHGIKGLEVYEATDEANVREDPFIPRRWILVKGKLFRHDEVDKAFAELEYKAKNENDAIKAAKAMIMIVEHKVKFYPDYPGLNKPKAVKMGEGYQVNIEGAVESAGSVFERARGGDVKPKITKFTANVGIDGQNSYGFSQDLSSN